MTLWWALKNNSSKQEDSEISLYYAHAHLQMLHEQFHPDVLASLDVRTVDFTSPLYLFGFSLFCMPDVWGFKFRFQRPIVMSLLKVLVYIYSRNHVIVVCCVNDIILLLIIQCWKIYVWKRCIIHEMIFVDFIMKCFVLVCFLLFSLITTLCKSGFFWFLLYMYAWFTQYILQ